MADEIKIVVDDVNDIEARVTARYCGDTDGVVVSGTIRGPFCAKARTLPAVFAFRGLCNDKSAAAEAIVPDPCTWSEEVPHTYQVDVEVRRDEQVVAEYHGTIGLRPNAVKRNA